jgi:hypothetical protein
MRIFVIILGSAIIGAALGTAAAVVAFRSDPDVPLPLASNSSTAPAAKAEVAEPVFNFGKMQRGTWRTHDFVVKNVGTALLTLAVGETSCKCTLGVAADKPVPPGESVPVRLEWTANSPPGPFRQTATLVTNDRAHSHVTLTIEGEVIAAEGVEPPEFMFDKVSAGDTRTAHVFVMSMLEEEVKIESAELVHPETSKYFEISVDPAPREMLPNKDAKAGVRISLRLKPGMSLGPFTQSVAVRTSLRDVPTLDIPVSGRIVGDISIHGTHWDEARSFLGLGRVKSTDGKKGELTVLIRGPAATDVKLSVASFDPPELRVIIGEPRRLSDTIVQVPVGISVPPGTPPMVRLGTEQGSEGRVLLNTTHPIIKELSIGVRFSVER